MVWLIVKPTNEPIAKRRIKPLTRLQEGMIVMLDGAEHRVDLVNDCRARCAPLRRVRVTIKDRFDNVRTFDRMPPAVSISPNSEIRIVRWEKPAPVMMAA
jgi:hypothetical protein